MRNTVLFLLLLHLNVHLSLAQESECLTKEELIPYRIKTKWGYSDVNGKIIIPVQYDSAGHFGFNREKKPLATVKVNNNYFRIDKTGQKVSDSITGDLRVGIRKALTLAMLQQQLRELMISLHSDFPNGKYGYIEGNDTILPPIYSAFGFSDKELVALKEDKWKLFSTQGKLLTKHKYDSIYPFNGSEVSIVKKDGKFGLIDKSGHEILKPTYEEIHPFSSGQKLMIAKDKKGKYGLINKKGDVVDDFKYIKVIRYYYTEFKLFKVYITETEFGLINCDGLKYFE